MTETENHMPDRNSLFMLIALQNRQVYQGTVPAATKARNRAANKVARKSRRLNRKRGA